MRTIIIGNNIAACELLEKLLEDNEEIVGIVAENKDCMNKSVGWERPFMKCAEKISQQRSIPLYIGNINDYAEEIKRIKPDLIASCRNICLIRPEILRIPEKGITNLHYGMLPKYGGCDTIPHAILNGEIEIGVTLHFMDKNFDSGKIIFQGLVNIDKEMRKLIMPHRTIEVSGLTAHESYCAANKLGVFIYLEQYKLIKNGKEQARNQDLTKKLYYKRGEINYLTDNIIDLEKSSDEEIARHARAFSYPAKKSKPYGIYMGRKIEMKLK